MTFYDRALSQVERNHWRWTGEVPGEPDVVRSAATDALRLMRATSIVETGDSLIGGMPGLFGPRWGAVEDLTVRLTGADGGGTRLQVDSKSRGRGLDLGRNRANVVKLLAMMGINER
jgi:hypothetical protein